MAEEGQCTAIVAYEVTAEDRDKFLNAWKKADEYLRQQPGYISSSLHEAASANPDFRFVNVGCWASADDFRKATQSIGFREASGSLEAYPIHAAAYEVVEI
jgi:heme oxygenase (mycobilin-producing)